MSQLTARRNVLEYTGTPVQAIGRTTHDINMEVIFRFHVVVDLISEL